MAYRGEDLDLRLPQQRSGRDTYVPSEFGLNGTRPRTPLASGAREPVVIDDTVMACCNHAYDIAQAHGASEVRLEHLVHALTRVEAAAEILEERGIREAHLRRESAAVIASEIPVGLAHSQSAPRASAEFEDVLRRASDSAATNPGSRGASVHDLLWVLLNYNREIPAIALLLRHAAGWQSWDWPNRPAAARETVRETLREDAPRRRDPVRSLERPMERGGERPPDRSVERRSARPAPAYAPPEPRERNQSSALNTDALQSRIDLMDQSLRAMQAEMAADRRAMTDLMRDVQQAMRTSTSGAESGALIEQLRAVEANVEDRLVSLSRTASTLTDRLHGLEQSVSGSLQEGSRNWMAVGNQLKSIDKVVATNANSGLADLVTDQLVTVTEQVRVATQRLEALERTSETRQAEGLRLLSSLGERLRAVDDNISAQRREQQLTAGAQNPAAMQSVVVERFQALKGQLDQHRADVTTSVTMAVTQAVEPLAARLQQLETMADRRQSENSQLMQTVLQRVATVEPALQTMAQRVATTEPVLQTIVQRVANNEPALHGIGQRLATFEAALKTQADTSKGDLGEVHDALVKLGTNQQTLAGNLEQWRTESGTDLGTIASRLERLERGTAQPVEMLAQLQADMQGVQQLALVEYDHNRRGFKHWLFGTDDVFAGSWRDETAAVRARLKQLKTAPPPPPPTRRP